MIQEGEVGPAFRFRHLELIGQHERDAGHPQFLEVLFDALENESFAHAAPTRAS
jgi:hypothetical protein